VGFYWTTLVALEAGSPDRVEFWRLLSSVAFDIWRGGSVPPANDRRVVVI
jgi:hypothetical protein